MSDSQNKQPSWRSTILLSLACMGVFVVLGAWSMWEQAKEPPSEGYTLAELELTPTATPRPLQVTYIDTEELVRALLAEADEECVETPERAAPFMCGVARRLEAADHRSYACSMRAGSKEYKFRIENYYHGVHETFCATYEQMLACVNEGEYCPEKPQRASTWQWRKAMAEVLATIEQERTTEDNR